MIGLNKSMNLNNIDVNIIDISHNVECFNINQATHVLKTCFKNFPKSFRDLGKFRKHIFFVIF